MRYSIFISFLLLLISCNEKIDNGSTYNREYTVGSLPDSNHLTTLNEQEKLLYSDTGTYGESIDTLVKNKVSKSLGEKMDFINNRSRIHLTEVTNGVESVKDESKFNSDGFSTTCDCGLARDTLVIKSGIGFFGGIGFSVKVFGNQFRSSFYEYIDDVKPYKLTKDAAFTDNISVESKYQYLQFDRKPAFTAGQQLTGFLTLTSNDFYEKRIGEELDTRYVKVKLKFTCVTKKIREEYIKATE